MENDYYSLDEHLQQAILYLEKAMDESIELVLNKGQSKKEIGRKWEDFFARFLNDVRQKSLKHKVNLYGWITFPRLRHKN